MSVCLITGASRGIGLASAVHFARAGETVVAGVRQKTSAAEVTRHCAQAGVEVEVVVLDVDHEASVVQAVSEVTQRFGGVDVLVNNAGLGLRSSVEDASDGDVRRLFETNVFGPLRLVRCVLPMMRERGGGAVVNVSSLSGRVGSPFAGIYSATKFALEGLSEALCYEVSPFNIRVVLIEPGRVATGFSASQLGTGSAESAYAERLGRWEEAMERLPGRQAGVDAATVAVAIYEAATQADHPLRRLVGLDAEVVGRLRRDLDDAEFERTVRQTLDFWD